MFTKQFTARGIISLNSLRYNIIVHLNTNVFLFFLAFDICPFCVVIWYFHPRQNGQRPPTSNDLLSQIVIHYIYLPILILEKEPVFPFFNVQCYTRELLVPVLYRLWYGRCPNISFFHLQLQKKFPKTNRLDLTYHRQ